jgi:hypothetical protein
MAQKNLLEGAMIIDKYSISRTGAVTQYYGDFMGPGFYMPYTLSGYTPGFYGGFGIW